MILIMTPNLKSKMLMHQLNAYAILHQNQLQTKLWIQMKHLKLLTFYKA